MRIALFEPDIAANVGTIIRLGACMAVAIDIIEPCGFPFGDASLKRAGLDYLPRAGTAVLNADDPFRGDWFARAPCEDRITFGFSRGADCHVVGKPEYGAAGSEFTLQLPDGDEVDVWLPLLGRQNVANALAAAAAAQAAGASAEDISDGLAHAVPVRDLREAAVC